jgi:hypothetical protein
VTVSPAPDSSPMTTGLAPTSQSESSPKPGLIGRRPTSDGSEDGQTSRLKFPSVPRLDRQMVRKGQEADSPLA